AEDDQQGSRGDRTQPLDVEPSLGLWCFVDPSSSLKSFSLWSSINALRKPRYGRPTPVIARPLGACSTAVAKSRWRFSRVFPSLFCPWELIQNNRSPSHAASISTSGWPGSGSRKDERSWVESGGPDLSLA